MFYKWNSTILPTWRINQFNIRNLIKITYITAVAFIISNFHIAVPIHGIEIEKIGISQAVYFLLIGTVNFKVLLWSISILPIIDHLFHGHSFMILPFEILVNNLILITVYGFWKFTTPQNYFGKKIVFVSGALFAAITIRVAYDLLLLTIFATNFWDETKIAILFNVGIFTTINVIKYGIVIWIMLYLKKRREFKKAPNGTN